MTHNMKPTTRCRRLGLLTLAAVLLTASFLALPASPALAVPASPPWVRCGIVYEIFPRNFSPEGNFNGITAHLDELKDLGVNILWLMPIHPLGEKLRKLAANLWRRVALRQDCCGHEGEPGC